MDNIALKITYRDPKELIPYPRNAKKHTKNKINYLKGLIKKFGFVDPVLLNGDKGILAGHGRTMTALAMKLKSIPTIDISHLSPEDQKAFILAHNKSSEFDLSWDMDLVNLELESLVDSGFDIEITGFDLSFDRDIADAQGIENFSDNEPSDNDEDEDYKEAATHIPEQSPDINSKKNIMVYPIYIMASKPLYEQYKQMRGNLSDADFLEILLEQRSA